MLLFQQEVDRWADKDFLLNVMGYHHFHLGNIQEGKNNADRTDYILFAEVNRDKFIVVDIFDHTVFETNINASITVTAERERLWGIFDERTLRRVPPGSIFIPSMIMTSGHSFHIVRRAQDYIHVIKEIDPKLDDYKYVRGLFEEAEVPMPQKYKLSWYLNFLDFGVLDSLSGIFFVLRYGVN